MKPTRNASPTAPTSNPASAPRPPRVFGALLGALLLVFGVAAIASLPGPAAADEPGQGGMPDLSGALRQVEGCLGVDTARTTSGKNVIFAWFEDREACLRWYYSDTHMAMMSRFFPRRDGTDHDDEREPLAGVPEGYEGPILAVASITYTKGDDRLEGIPLPISQIAIELYAPLTGGLHLGGRFAPDGMKLASTRDVTLDYGSEKGAKNEAADEKRPGDAR